MLIRDYKASMGKIFLELRTELIFIQGIFS